MPDRIYRFPVDDFYARTVHTPAGVRNLPEKSQLMSLLRDLDGDGHDVSAPAAELAALMNYVTSSQKTMRDMLMHIDYCSDAISRQTK